MAQERQIGAGRNNEFGAASEYAQLGAEQPEAGERVPGPQRIVRADLRPRSIAAGETEIVLQRHGVYVTEADDPQLGSLTPEAAATERAAETAFLRDFIEQVPEAERSEVDILVVASDTQYHGGGRRSLETAQLAQAAAAEVLAGFGLSDDQIINTSGRLDGDGGPRPMAKLREPNFLNEAPDPDPEQATPRYLDYMLDKYNGINIDFWVAFEEDHDREMREALGAEGPDQIADRVKLAVRVFDRYAQRHHAAHPDRRLLIWASTHYDTISPYVKREIMGAPKEQPLRVDNGAGIVIDINRAGTATTQLGGEPYPVPLER